jgi:hypothetical protein
VELGSSKPVCWRWCSPCWSAAESGRRETTPFLWVTSGVVGLVADRGWCCCAPFVAALQADQLLTRTWCSPSDWVRKRRLMNPIMEKVRNKDKVKITKEKTSPKFY